MDKLVLHFFRLLLALACVAMVAAFAAVSLSVLSRLFGWDMPGLDAYAGYAIAAALFLALPSTLVRGEHIRVTLVLDRLPATIQLALVTVTLVTLLAVALALIAVWQRGKAIERGVVFIATALACVPSFWLALVLILLFAVNLSWLPTSGYGGARLLSAIRQESPQLRQSKRVHPDDALARFLESEHRSIAAVRLADACDAVGRLQFDNGAQRVRRVQSIRAA